MSDPSRLALAVLAESRPLRSSLGEPTATAESALQTGVTFADPMTAAVTLVVFALLSLLGAGSLAITYRWYFKQSVPEGISILVGVAVVALYINTASLGAAVGEGAVDLFRPGVVFFNITALGVATAAAPAGRRIGDTLSTRLFSVAGLKQFEGEMGTVVRSVGRVTSVTLPETIEDMESYDPVTAETKNELAGKTLVFPRRLTVEQLRTRLVERLKEDYSVGYVDVDLTDEATIEYLALGIRIAGIGATLAPGTVAVAVRADPPNNAAAGDMVQVWRVGETTERVVTGELRATAGDTATLAVDEGDASALSPTESYRLLTLPAEPRADREFATLLRGVDETMSMVTVGANSDLAGSTPRSLTATVLAIRPVDGKITALPDRDRGFAAGETIYVLGRPDVLRRLEERAAAPAVDPDAAGDTDASTTAQSDGDGEPTSTAAATTDANAPAESTTAGEADTADESVADVDPADESSTEATASETSGQEPTDSKQSDTKS